MPSNRTDQDIAARIAQLSPAKRALLEKRLKEQSASGESRPIQPRSDLSEVPLTFSQESLWFLTQLAPDKAVYNRPLGIHLTGPLEVDNLRLSLNQIILRHEILRSTFPIVNEQPVQVVGAAYNLECELVDLSQDAEAVSTCERLKTELLKQPFDLARGPLVRAVLYRFAPDDHLLLLSMHHIVFDGWSTTIFLRELSSLYKAFCEGASHTLEPLPIHYPNFPPCQPQKF